MSRLELRSFKEMRPDAVRSWLWGSFVVASTVAAAFIIIASSNFESGLDSQRAAKVEAAQVSAAQAPQ